MKKLALRVPSPLVEVRDVRLEVRRVRLFLKRDDLIHPDLAGNKWRKLKYNLQAARDQRFTKLLSFGGAYSNHLRSLAAAGHYLGFETIGVVRGEERLPINGNLARAAQYGMHLSYMDRLTYRRKREFDFVERLRAEFGDFYLIPEGGSNVAGVHGCEELVEEIEIDFDIICCACGTGTTLAGMAAALRGSQRAVGFAALKEAGFLHDDVSGLQDSAFGGVTRNWSIELGYHFGGYAKKNAELDAFVSAFELTHGLLLDWVYEAKMMYGVFDLVERGEVEEESVIVAVVAGAPNLP